MICRLLMVLILLSWSSQLAARTWHVLDDGSGDAPTIQAGIDSAAAGDSVLVAASTYFETLDFLGKEIVVISEQGALATTIDGSNSPGPVVTFSGGETRSTSLEGFTVTGGTPVSSRAGGIHCRASSPVIRSNIIIHNSGDSAGGIRVVTGSPLPSPLIENNTIQDNDAGNLGGGIEVGDSNTIIRGNLIIGNRSPDDGGGIAVFMREGTVDILDNILMENIAGDKGGGIYLGSQNVTEVHVERNVLIRNEAKWRIRNETGAGGGIYTENARGRIVHNTLVGNVSRDRRACGGGGITLSQNIGLLEVTHNIIAGNSGCGIACIIVGRTVVEKNLLWDNEGGDLGTSDRACPEEWANLMTIANPFFCDSDADDYTVAENSPTLEPEVMGAFAEPGCGKVSAHPTTWGRIKAKYGD